MTTELRLAERQDIPALCGIWKACFADSEEYINLFYSNNFERLETYVLCVNGKPVSMVNLLPAAFAHRARSLPAKFIYAAGTLPAYRKKGYMGRLIKHVTSLAKETGYALFLKPATSSVMTYYQKFGFEKDSCLRLVNVSPTDSLPLAADELDAAAYNRMRDAAFDGLPFVKWDDAHVSWCVEENAFFSGKTLKIKQPDKDYFLMGYPEGDTLIINETDLPLDRIRLLSGALCRLFGARQLRVYLSDYFCDEGECLPASVIYNAPAIHTYANLILI